jgi:hypothetical protein
MQLIDCTVSTLEGTNFWLHCNMKDTNAHKMASNKIVCFAGTVIVRLLRGNYSFGPGVMKSSWDVFDAVRYGAAVWNYMNFRTDMLSEFVYENGNTLHG